MDDEYELGDDFMDAYKEVMKICLKTNFIQTKKENRL